jgi:hypothetical protein
MAGKKRRFSVGDRVREGMHGPGTILARESDGYLSVKIDSGVCFLSHARNLVPHVTGGQTPEAYFRGSNAPESSNVAARQDLIAILEELRAQVQVLALDRAAFDRRSVDFGALASRLQECIEWVAVVPGGRAGARARKMARVPGLSGAAFEYHEAMRPDTQR